MAKLPYLPLYTGDWRKDPALCLCTTATRGVWIDLLCAMHDFDRSGELRGTADQLARIARCSTVEVAHALTDLQTTGAAEVTERNGVYIVRNRRMYKDALRRKSNADRQERRRIDKSNDDVTGVSRLDTDIDIEIAFESFWKVFPEGRKKSKAPAREAFEKAIRKTDAAVLISAAQEYAASDEGQGQFVKMPSTWLNQECWQDNRNAWKTNGKPATQRPRSQRYIGE